MNHDVQDLVTQSLQELGLALESVDERTIAAMLRALRGAKRIFTAGKGRSGLQMQAFAMRLMHLGLQTFFVDDVTTPGIRKGDLLLIGSGSGHTPSLVGYTQKAKSLGAKVALITADQTSPIAKQADVVLLLSAPTPKAQKRITSQSIHPMGTLFEQALGLLGDLVILLLMEEMDIDADEMFARHANLE
jgi:6-phospho-3-hexuloisomerase